MGVSEKKNTCDTKIVSIVKCMVDSAVPDLNSLETFVHTHFDWILSLGPSRLDIRGVNGLFRSFYSPVQVIKLFYNLCGEEWCLQLPLPDFAQRTREQADACIHFMAITITKRVYFEFVRHFRPANDSIAVLSALRIINADLANPGYRPAVLRCLRIFRELFFTRIHGAFIGTDFELHGTEDQIRAAVDYIFFLSTAGACSISLTSIAS